MLSNHNKHQPVLCFSCPSWRASALMADSYHLSISTSQTMGPAFKTRPTERKALPYIRLFYTVSRKFNAILSESQNSWDRIFLYHPLWRWKQPNFSASSTSSNPKTHLSSLVQNKYHYIQVDRKLLQHFHHPLLFIITFLSLSLGCIFLYNICVCGHCWFATDSYVDASVPPLHGRKSSALIYIYLVMLNKVASTNTCL